MQNDTNNVVPTASKRLEVIDALRGFALLGIILVHSCQIFPKSGTSSHLDHTITLVVSHLFAGRASATFCFLFGLSFAIQIQSASSQGKPFVGHFIWRLIILLVIGYLHTYIYSNDILQEYALLGLTLLLFIKEKNNRLLAISILLYLVSIIVVVSFSNLRIAASSLMLQIKDLEAVKLMGLDKLDKLLLSGRLFLIPSLFILGFYAGRIRIFHDTLENRLIIKRILICAGIAVVTSTLIYYLIKFTTTSDAISQAFYRIRQISQTFFYIALIAILYRLDFFHKILKWLVPLGKMGLTIYIMQSIILKLYYRLGADVIPELGLTASIGITILFYIAQIIFATWWMSRYRSGPLEWLWRSLTYFKWQPMLKHSYPSSNSEATNSRLPA